MYFDGIFCGKREEIRVFYLFRMLKTVYLSGFIHI